MRLYLIALLLVSSFGVGATISGTAVEWYTFEPLDNAIVEINTTPKQLLVTQKGAYKFDVPNGTYTLRAQYFDENTLMYEAQEEVTVQGDGNFTLDLIMFPAIEEHELILDDANNLEFTALEEEEQIPPNAGQIRAEDLVIPALVFVAAAALVLWSVVQITSRESEIEKEIVEKPEPKKLPAQPKQDGPSDDLKQAIDTLRNYGGRMTQKELRDRLPFGEAKVSLIVAELEQMDKIKKFKKGRGNVIILK
ncbi:MAG: hypothetical protein NUV67_03450 [archaeon]|nr:hypothetical protein [archaeon]